MGEDLIDGGAGNDFLSGDVGNDTYLFRRGTGQDRISEFDLTVGNTDRIWLGRDIAPTDVTLRRSGVDLLLKINGSSDGVTVQNYFRDDNPAYRIERIEFGDGTVWTTDDIYRIVLTPTDGDDEIHGAPGADTIHGLGGNDRLFGEAGDDVLYGDAGNDSLFGGNGSDTLDGDTGNDRLDGGTGNDTYLFRRGTGGISCRITIARRAIPTSCGWYGAGGIHRSGLSPADSPEQIPFPIQQLSPRDRSRSVPIFRVDGLREF